MRRAVLALAVIGLGVAAAGVYAMRSAGSPPQRPMPAGPDTTIARETASPAGEAALPQAPRVRAVASDVVAPPQVAPDELVRVEPRAPLSTFAAPTRRKKNHGRVFRPLIESAGAFSGSGLRITLAGIAPTPPGRVCTDAAGTQWPCGARARAAFRAFVRGRALLCDLPEELAEARYTVACSLGQQDAAAWLVAQGWAEALEGGDYAAGGAAARAAGKGMFGAAPVIEPLPNPEPYVSALPEPLPAPALE